MKNSGNAMAFVEKARYLDKEGRAQIPLALLLVFLYQLRGYVAGIISLTFADDRTRLLDLFYQSSEQFGLMLLVGLPALVVLLATTFAGEDEPNWANAVMRFSQPLLLAAWLFDGVLIGSLIVEQHAVFSFALAAIVMGWLISLWYLLKSRHWRFYRQHLATVAAQTQQ